MEPTGLPPLPARTAAEVPKLPPRAITPTGSSVDASKSANESYKPALPSRPPEMPTSGGSSASSSSQSHSHDGHTTFNGQSKPQLPQRPDNVGNLTAPPQLPPSNAAPSNMPSALPKLPARSHAHSMAPPPTSASALSAPQPSLPPRSTSPSLPARTTEVSPGLPARTSTNSNQIADTTQLRLGTQPPLPNRRTQSQAPPVSSITLSNAGSSDRQPISPRSSSTGPGSAPSGASATIAPSGPTSLPVANGPLPSLPPRQSVFHPTSRPTSFAEEKPLPSHASHASNQPPLPQQPISQVSVGSSPIQSSTSAYPPSQTVPSRASTLAGPSPILPPSNKQPSPPPPTLPPHSPSPTGMPSNHAVPSHSTQYSSVQLGTQLPSQNQRPPAQHQPPSHHLTPSTGNTPRSNSPIVHPIHPPSGPTHPSPLSPRPLPATVSGPTTTAIHRSPPSLPPTNGAPIAANTDPPSLPAANSEPAKPHNAHPSSGGLPQLPARSSMAPTQAPTMRGPPSVDRSTQPVPKADKAVSAHSIGVVETSSASPGLYLGSEPGRSQPPEPTMSVPKAVPVRAPIVPLREPSPPPTSSAPPPSLPPANPAPPPHASSSAVPVLPPTSLPPSLPPSNPPSKPPSNPPSAPPKLQGLPAHSPYAANAKSAGPPPKVPPPNVNRGPPPQLPPSVYSGAPQPSSNPQLMITPSTPQTRARARSFDNTATPVAPRPSPAPKSDRQSTSPQASPSSSAADSRDKSPRKDKSPHKKDKSPGKKDGLDADDKHKGGRKRANSADGFAHTVRDLTSDNVAEGSYSVMVQTPQKQAKILGESGYIMMYPVEVKKGPQTWTIFRRYNQFYQLDTDLKRNGLFKKAGIKSSIPPKKSGVSKKDPLLLETRRRGFQVYLDAICSSAILYESDQFYIFIQPLQMGDTKPISTY